MTAANDIANATPAAGRLVGSQMRRGYAWLVAYIQAMPLIAVFLVFFCLPMFVVLVVSFFDYQTYDILIPDFVTFNYTDVFSASVTWQTYWITLKFCLIAWVLTLLLGFTIAYYLAFYVGSLKWQIVLFLICTIPFWTSNVIRSISWIPLLGRNGLVNDVLLGLGVVEERQEWLLYSEFSVVLGYIHLYTLFMIVPIFNSMMRIDKSLIEAAADAGASEWKTIWHVVIPLCKPGIAIGTIFVVAIVMGDFVTVNVLGGGQVASVGKTIFAELGYLQYPPAAANAVALMAIVILMIVGLLRVVDIRREL